MGLRNTARPGIKFGPLRIGSNHKASGAPSSLTIKLGPFSYNTKGTVTADLPGPWSYRHNLRKTAQSPSTQGTSGDPFSSAPRW